MSEDRARSPQLDLPLAGIRVLDLTRNLAGPYCTMALGDLGADVVKVEAPSRGDDTRAWAPFGPAGSTMFAAANRNKRSVVLDLDDEGAVRAVRRLADEADVLVESFRPGSLERRGLGYDDLRASNPRLVYCSISAFGDHGPRRLEPGYDPVVQAASGMMSITGEPDGPPVRLGISPGDLGAGVWATTAILAALYAREHSGRGAHVTTSLFETAAWWLSYHLAGYYATGVEPRRLGSASPAIAPYETFPTGDGELFIAAANDALFRTLCNTLSAPELADDPRFFTNPLRVQNIVELRASLREKLANLSAANWEARLKAEGVPCSAVATVGQFARDPQIEALALLDEGDPPLIRIPVMFEGVRPPTRIPPPALGEHTASVLGCSRWPSPEPAG
jgi:formyl-CoA transferase/CoA:oxalate CoA-transferase